MTTLDDELQDAIERGELEPNTWDGRLDTLVEIVRQSRERTAGVFPLPDVDSCIDYAITEAGEYLDAVLREKRDADKRNRDKDHDARKEWAQTGYMICSAIIQVPTDHLDALDWQAYVDADSITLYKIMRTLTEVRDGTNRRWENPHVDALDEWSALAVKCGYEPAELLRETCAAFEAKHLPVVRGYDFVKVKNDGA